MTIQNLLVAQRHMMELKGKPGHAEQVKIVREIEKTLADLGQMSA